MVRCERFCPFRTLDSQKPGGWERLLRSEFGLTLAEVRRLSWCLVLAVATLGQKVLIWLNRRCQLHWNLCSTIYHANKENNLTSHFNIKTGQTGCVSSGNPQLDPQVA